MAGGQDMTKAKPIGITMGDPAGVGPEIICKALTEMEDDERAQTVVIGDVHFLQRASALVKADLVFGRAFEDLAEGVVGVVDVPARNREAIRPGAICDHAGELAYRCVEKAVTLAVASDISVIVTAPLNKEALHAAGHKYDGHTGLLAHLTGAPSSFMLLVSDKLATVHVSTHVSLRQATGQATRQRVLETIRAGNAHFKRLGLASPRIAVAGLNPHSGEHGLFGSEEIDAIGPAVEDAQAEKINVVGPIPADTVFHRALKGEFDLVVAQYHDQGHIPCKLIAFDETVNVSLGLPIMRTSVDHGTAFDVAWKGLASHCNMKAAIAYARRMAGLAPAA